MSDLIKKIKIYGGIDLHHLPPRKKMREWGREARETYTASCEKTFERYEIEYVWKKVTEWQRKK